jgi:hypothetical protein
MRLSRHAKNELRHLKGALDEVREVIANPVDVDRDDDERPRFIGYIQGIRVRVVIALDDPDFVVTIHKRRN